MLLPAFTAPAATDREVGGETEARRAAAGGLQAPASCPEETAAEAAAAGREMGCDEVEEDALGDERSGRQAAAANGPASCIRCASDAGERPPVAALVDEKTAPAPPPVPPDAAAAAAEMGDDSGQWAAALASGVPDAAAAAASGNEEAPREY